MDLFKSSQAKAKRLSAFAPICNSVLQRACACGQHTSGGGECDRCKQKRAAKLQRAPIGMPPVGEVPPIVHEVLRSPGQPLDPATRAFMEPRFGHDFGNVRVHTDVRAAESAKAINAAAYTVGPDVVFGEGQYVPTTQGGKRVLAHELTHVLHQSAGGTSTARGVDGGAGDQLEQSASRQAESLRPQRPAVLAETSVPRLQRQQTPTQPPPDRTFRERWDSQLQMLKRMFSELRYGCWCGKGHKCPAGYDGPDPYDAIDSCCKDHDEWYDDLDIWTGDTPAPKGYVDMWSIEGLTKSMFADLAFVACTQATRLDRFIGPAGRLARGFIAVVFGIRVAIATWIMANMPHLVSLERPTPQTDQRSDTPTRRSR